MARRRGSKPSFAKLLLWAMGMFLFGALVALLIQSSFKQNKSSVVIPATDTAKDVQPSDSEQPPVYVPSDPVIKPETPKPNATDSVTEQPKKPLPTQPIIPKQPRFALVIDDLGQADPSLVLRLCSMNIPLTVAVLPFLPHSGDSARIAKSKGMEIILHMPMEPVGYPGPGKNPGTGAILMDQTETEVRQRVVSAMQNIPYAIGLNNHMGSRITPDSTKMTWILEEIKKSNWYFLDSRTERDTVAMEVARSLGVPALERRVFLDDSLDPAEMAHQWERALALAKHDGHVVIIGHIHTETVSFLEKAIPVAINEVTFVKASALLR